MKKAKRVSCLALCLLMLIGLLPMWPAAYAYDRYELTELSATITLPEAGATPVHTGTPGNSTSYTVRNVAFYHDGVQIGDEEIFRSGATYVVYVNIRPGDGYEIPADAILTVNGIFKAVYHTRISDGYGTTAFSFEYTVPPAETTGHRIEKVYLYGIRVPVVGEELLDSFIISAATEYEKDSETIRWTKKSGAFEVSCAPDEIVREGTYYAAISLVVKGEVLFANNPQVMTQCYGFDGVVVQNKVVSTRVETMSDNQRLYIKLEFCGATVFDYTYELTNAPGHPHGQPKVGEHPWSSDDIVSCNRDTDLARLFAAFYKDGSLNPLNELHSFEANQVYVLDIEIDDGYTAIIKPGTLICYYDDDTGLYLEGKLERNGHARMEFTPIDPYIHEAVVCGFSRPVLGGTVEEHTTAWADASIYGAEYELVSQGWYTNVGFDPLAPSYTFLPRTDYFSEIVLAPKNDYRFAEDVEVTLKDMNGNAVELVKVELRRDGTLMIRTVSFSIQQSLSMVRVYDFVPPTVGRTAGSCYPRISTGAVFNNIAWYNVTDGVTMEDGDYFEAGKTYYLMFTVKAESDAYYLTADTYVVVTRKRSNTVVELLDSSFIPEANVIVCSTVNMPAVVCFENIQIGGYRAPVVGQSAGYPYRYLVPGDNGLEITTAFWVDSSYNPLRATDRFRAGEKYSLCVRVEVVDGYFDISSPFNQVKLYDVYGNSVPLQWEGAGEYAIGYIPGTDTYRFYSEFVAPIGEITDVSFYIRVPVSGGTPDYEPVYPAGAHYYSANDLDAEDPEYYKNDINWDYCDVGFTFSGGDHNLYMQITAEEGYGFPSDPEQIDITVNGYEIGRYPATVSVIAENKLELYITFTEAGLYYKVQFSNNGHGVTPQTQYVANGDTAVDPEAPTAEGWTFGGWFTEPECDTRYDFGTPVTGDIILYAKWTEGVSFMRGDMDKDGEITVGDALIALRIAARLTEKTEEYLMTGDVDNDGDITVGDALKILRVAARLDDQSALE